MLRNIKTVEKTLDYETKGYNSDGNIEIKLEFARKFANSYIDYVLKKGLFDMVADTKEFRKTSKKLYASDNFRNPDFIYLVLEDKVSKIFRVLKFYKNIEKNKYDFKFYYKLQDFIEVNLNSEEENIKTFKGVVLNLSKLKLCKFTYPDDLVNDLDSKDIAISQYDSGYAFSLEVKACIRIMIQEGF